MSEENESIEFIEQVVERSTSHIIRHSEEVKGVVEIQVKNDGTYSVKVTRGTDTEVQVLQDLSKEQLISVLEDRL